jgi:endonuclease/exonuclease/phosphatase family metal-dependent hydrolase
VVAVQELGPGRADGRTGTTKGTPRQTTSLETALARVGGGRYQLVRTTPYVAPGRKTSTQGQRILYDTKRYTLLTRCPEKTGSRSYSASCSFPLPLLSSDTESDRRRVAVAQFRDRRTGKRFWFASLHLDARHSSKTATERRYDALRRSQVRTAVARVAQFNRSRVPVVIGGDFNSWQNSRVANSAHDWLISQGYYDTSAAVTRVHFSYTTYNAFRTKVPPASHGIGVRLDMLFVKGARGAKRYENVLKGTDSSRPSDHNLILSDVVL